MANSLAGTPRRARSAGSRSSTARVTFRQFVAEQIAAATAAAEMHERFGRDDLAETWRGRVRDLQAYLDERLAQTQPAPGQA